MVTIVVGVIALVLGFIGGMARARNLNEADRNYWIEQGRNVERVEKDEIMRKVMESRPETYR